ncbi:tyrosine--tRNA ligase, partial [bacterium]|nr:tyrosine--tRNA ligase [bacterium]
PAADLDGDGLPLIDALADAGLAGSKGEARRLIRQGGIKVNGERIDDEMRMLVPGDVRVGRIVLQAGKKRHHHILVA